MRSRLSVAGHCISANHERHTTEGETNWLVVCTCHGSPGATFYFRFDTYGRKIIQVELLHDTTAK